VNDPSVGAALLFLGVSVVVTAAGVLHWRMDRLFRFNHWRRVYHHNMRTLADARWAWGCMLPFGIALLLLAVGGLISVLALPDPLNGVVSSVWLLTVLAALVTLVVMLVRRRSLQPAWMREEIRRERAGLASNVPLPPEGDRQVVSQRVKRLAWIWVALVFLAAVPAGLWIGAGIALALLFGACARAALVASWRTRD
jgi:hypothetical protein